MTSECLLNSDLKQCCSSTESLSTSPGVNKTAFFLFQPIVYSLRQEQKFGLNFSVFTFIYFCFYFFLNYIYIYVCILRNAWHR